MKMLFKKFGKLATRINLEVDSDYKLAIINNYKIDFNNGTTILMQENEKYGYIKTNDVEKVIILSDSFIKLIKGNI